MNNISYRYRRIHQALLRDSIKISKKTVYKLMKINNLFARYPKKRHKKLIKNDRQFISKYLLKNVGWKIGNTMDTRLCTDTLNDAVARQKTAPYIINSDQGSQYRSSSWHELVKSINSQLSMEGIGRWADNVYIERFWNILT